ncbi:BamA/TamA family outer membrane protein [bacterium]|nr:BamA/TamA family outer membrane protein [bacterium]
MLVQFSAPAEAAWFKNKEKKESAVEQPAVFKDPELIKTDKEKEEAEKLKNNPNAVYIKEIQFDGNKLIANSEIATAMKVQAGDVYSRDMVQQSLKQIYQMGYFTEKIKALPIKIDEHNVILKITVEENLPITGFTIEGNEVLTVGEITNAINYLKGKPQNMVLVNQAITDIEEVYAEKGYILARVTAVFDDPDGVINFEVEEGHINSIAIEGNKKTKDFVIERNILSKPGEVYNENQIKSDLTRLYGTQAFKDVTRSIQKTNSDTDLYDITINVEEQRTGTLSLGGGVDTATGLFATLGFAENNFRGLGQRVSLNVMTGTGIMLNDRSMLNRANIQSELSFYEPHLKGSDNSLLSKVFYRDFASYQIPLAIERRFGFETTLARPLNTEKTLRGQISLGIENIDVREGDSEEVQKRFAKYNIPISERAKQLEGGLFIGIAPSLIYDTRDNAITPRNGVLASIRFDQNVGLEDIRDTHGKITASIKKYYPVMKKSSFSLMGRAGGRLYGDMPEVMAYRLGGPYTIRGFRMSEVGTGDGFMMASAELLTPLLFLDRIEKVKFLDNVRLAFFADAGKLFSTSVSDRMYDRPGEAISVGVGLRVFVPGIGPLSVDWGYPLTNVGHGNKRGAFTFGVGEFY